MNRLSVGILGFLLLVALVVGVFWASGKESIGKGFEMVLADPWGVVTLLDLLVGLLFVALWIATTEKNPWVAAIWIVLLFGLGNIITLMVLIRRLIVRKSLAGALTNSDV